jgi:hypothetical protein
LNTIDRNEVMIKKFALIAFAAIFTSSTLLAIPIDDFSVKQTIFGDITIPVQSGVANPLSLGGSRSIAVTISSGDNLIATTNSARLTHSQGVNTTGETVVIWDGNGDATLDPVGLGGLDITSDTATGFVLSPLSFDFPNQVGINVILTVYSDSGRASSATAPLTQSFVNEKIELPFSSFSAIPGLIAADFTSIGAITLKVDGNLAPATDFELDFFGTNGICTEIPTGKKFIDECGVCNGNNSTCSDCSGTPNGTKEIDECGVCGGDSSLCKDCAGVPNGTTKIDECGVCGGDSTTCKDCAGVPNGNTKVDECGICGGDGSSCKGCDDRPNPTPATVDACGVCGGDSSSCQDCAGVPNGTAIVDACGICGGKNSTCKSCNSGSDSSIKPGSPCNTGLGGSCNQGRISRACSCEPVEINVAETCDGVDNDCDRLVDEGIECRVSSVDTGICSSSVIPDPYKSLDQLGAKEDRILKEGLEEYYFKTGRKNDKYKEFLKISAGYKEKIKQIVKILPKTTTFATLSCSCTEEDHSDELRETQKVATKWVELIQQLVMEIRSPDARGKPCTRTRQECLDETQQRMAKYKRLIAKMRNQQRRTQNLLENLPGSTRKCD